MDESVPAPVRFRVPLSPPPALPPMPSPSRSPIVLNVATLAVRFTWAGDRWHHVVTGAGGAVICRSVETTDERGGDPRWPDSPAFVEVTRLGPGDGAPVMAVGQAGRTHFSAVVLPDPAVPDAIRFDVAARLQEEPARLGSAYHSSEFGAGGSILRVEPGRGSTGSVPTTARWCYRVCATGIEALVGTVLAATGPAAAGGSSPA